MPNPRRRSGSRGHPRVHRIEVWFNDEEMLSLLERAGALGWTAARYLAEIGLGTVPTARRRASLTELAAVRRQIQGEAANLNQVAHRANEGRWIPAEVFAAVARVDALNVQLGDLIEALR